MVRPNAVISPPSKIKYEYDEQGRQKTLIANSGADLIIANNYTFTFAGGTATETAQFPFLGINTTENLTYNNRLQPNSRQVYKSTSCLGTNCLMDLSYDFTNPAGKNNGNVGEIQDLLDSANDQTFTYDALNRLDGMQASGWAISYTYDRYGNRLSATTTGTPPGTFRPQQTLQVDTRTNQILENYSQEAFEYDAAGNLLTDPEAGQTPTSGTPRTE